MTGYETWFATNRASWDSRTPFHVRSPMYDVPGFLGGELSLTEMEVALVGDVRGQKLPHLQCHFGLDTLSWARLGATVSGIDFSEAAIVEARRLADEAQIDAQFVCANVYETTKFLA